MAAPVTNRAPGVGEIRAEKAAAQRIAGGDCEEGAKQDRECLHDLRL